MTACIRGANTVENNNKEEMLEATEKMLKAIMEENNLVPEDIIAINFTATKDLDAVYPAVAARKIGITQAALMCMQEMYVKGSLEKCIRVCVMTEKFAQKDAKHVYLGEAVRLRPDLKR